MKRNLFRAGMLLWLAVSFWCGTHNLQQQGWVWSAYLCLTILLLVECYAP